MRHCRMHRYQLSTHLELIAGWARALTTARLDAARTEEIVTVTAITRRGARRSCTVFPSGEVVRDTRAHRLPADLSTPVA